MSFTVSRPLSRPLTRVLNLLLASGPALARNCARTCSMKFVFAPRWRSGTDRSVIPLVMGRDDADDWRLAVDAARVKFVAPLEPSVISATWHRGRFTVPSTVLR